MEELLQQSYFNNTVKDYLITLGIILVGLVVIKLVRNILLKRLQKWASKTDTNLDDYVVKGVERFALPVANFLVMYWALNYLVLPDKASRIIEVAVAGVLLFLFFVWYPQFWSWGSSRTYCGRGGGKKRLSRCGG